MTNKEAKEILLDMANELQLIPESKQGQAFKMALKLLNNENSMIQYLLDKEIAKLDSCKQEFFLYKKDIDIIKNFDGFKILDNGNYWYKGHNIKILEEVE